MSESNASVRITFRIPGAWAHPRELVERLPDGFRMTHEMLVMPDGTELEFTPMPPDNEFARIFESSCRRPATADEQAIVDRYTVNIALSGPGGSIPAAVTMMQAASAVVRAGGAGVFIDNCALSHGGRLWLDMTEDASPDAVSYAFVCIVGGKRELRTIGMHVMGFPDIVMPRPEDDADGDTIIEVIRYICNEVKPIGDGHILCDLDGPRYRATATTGDQMTVDSPMHNPFGRLRLTSFKDVAEEN